MAAQPPFINVRKYTVVCGSRRGMEGRDGENYGVVPSGKGEGTEINFLDGILRIQMGVREENMEKSRNLND
jgi:hypothetical protein